MREPHTITRRMAKDLAAIVRRTAWQAHEGGDLSIDVTHRDGTEVSITVRPPQPKFQPKVIRGFQP